MEDGISVLKSERGWEGKIDHLRLLFLLWIVESLIASGVVFLADLWGQLWEFVIAKCFH